jgi:hypothetical protein
MVPANLHQTATQINTPEKARLFALLKHLPAEARAEVYLGILLNLTDHFERNN